ncbi:MAG: M20/M25/M40 family metallo-hydrolase [Ruminiclostridium sp.]|nr:M20/M25/M40 family metallo-hydrolase [Ruminiclostridium sp.]MBQ9851895.1 M20/M25/M40 family metallo-hydrolase [Ruminiclostridium sp.]MBQ9933673.1 M20/M25/M40 family metallo-hydrolase [Ruminiclostridium sp.]
MDIKACLAALSSASGPSGRETPVALEAMEWVRRYCRQPNLHSAGIDRFGNLFACYPCGKPNAKKIVLDAHLDEVGLLITGAEDGFLRFRSVGGIDPRMLPNREVTILTEPPTFGLVAVLPPHVQKPGDANKSIPLDELYIDAGLTQEEGEKLVGTFAVPRGTVQSHLNDVVSGKALDDRAGFVTLLRTVELLKDEELDTDLWIMGSSREETNGGGALVGAFGIQPDCFIAVDVTHARTPDGPKEETFPAGKGTVIGIGPNITRWMSDRLIKKAEENGIPWLPEVMTGHTGTNAWGVQTAREGIPTAVVSLPLKYMHSPVETLDLADLEATASLLAAFVKDLAKEGGEFLAD